MATIKDVAKRAGVSTATVSHVINGTRTVLPDTRQAVLDAIEALNYRPSAVARGLTTNSTKTIGVVIADVTSPFFANLLHNIEDLLSQWGYNLFVCNTHEQVDREAYNLELLLDKRVDGVIITPTGHPQPIYEHFNKQKVPMVFIDRKPPGVDGSFVGVDNHRGSYQATQYLIELGHRRIGMVSLVPETSAVKARIAGYTDALKSAGLPVDPALITSSNFQVSVAAQAVCDLLELTDPPTAIIAGSHVSTLGALQALLSLGLEYPRDISLVCFDNSRWTGLVRPRLTVVTKPIAEIAQQAVEILLAAMTQAEQKRKKHEPIGEFEKIEHLMDSHFLVRESCLRLENA